MNPERIVGLYPRAWRDRYGEEFHQLLVDRLADGSAGRWWWLNPAAHGLRARLAGPRATPTWPAALFAVSAVSIWSQLAVGWHWARPANDQTGLGMVLMSAGLLLTVVGGAAHVRLVSWRTRSAATLLISTVALLGGALYVGHHWPGAVGHPWSGRDLVPAPLARIAWAATLSVSAYWAHPHALEQLGSLQLGWMAASLLLLTTIALSAARVTRRPAGRRSQLTIAGMGLFLIGALSWAVWGAPGPHGLYAPGVIDLVLVAANAGALAATATGRVA
jgi:hypothetical protein